MKKGLLLLVSVLLLLCLASCGGGQSTDTGADTQTGAPTGPLVLLENQQSNYAILVSDKNKELHTAASDFKIMFREKTGVSLEITTDWRTNEPKEFEVVIGEVDRENMQLTPELKSAIWTDGYVIMGVGNRIWICGENKDSTTEAVKYFVDNFVDPTYTAFERDFCYVQNRKEAAPVSDLTISGNKLSDYSILCDTSKKAVLAEAEKLQKALWDRAGSFLPIKNTDEGADKKIVLGTDASSGTFNYSVKTSGADLLLSGTNNDYLSEAVTFIMREFLGYGRYLMSWGYINTPENAAIADLNTTVSYNKIDSLTIAGKDISDFVIVYDVFGGTSANYAAQELQSFIEKTTGVTLPLEKDGNALLNKPQLRILCDEAMGESFSIKTDDLGVAFSGGKRGILYSVYNFLEDYIGWAFLPNLDVLLCEDKTVAIDSIDYEYDQVFEYRGPFWCASSYNAYAAKNMINYNNGRNGVAENLGGFFGFTGTPYHTISELMGTGNGLSANPCLYEENTYIWTLAGVKTLLKNNPNADIISVSLNDSALCSCDRCTGKGSGRNATDGLIEFVNRISDAVSAEYPNLKIHTLAYGETQPIPKVERPRDNVIIQLCGIRCCYQHPLEEECCEANYEFMTDIKAWSKITKNLYIWDYTCDNFYYLATFPNFDVLKANMQTFKKYGVTGVFAQGNAHNVSGEFGDLRSYLLAKLMEDPYMSDAEYDEYINTFMRGYYGPKWQNIRAYFDFLMEASNKMPHYGIYAKPEAMYSAEDFISKEDELDALFDEALAAATDDITYYNIRVLRVSYSYLKLFFTYPYVFKNGTATDRNELKAECAATFDDVVRENYRLIDNLSGQQAYVESVWDQRENIPRNWAPNKHGGRADLCDHGMVGSDKDYRRVNDGVYVYT